LRRSFIVESWRLEVNRGDRFWNVLRNDEAHFNRRPITETGAEKMLKVGMEMVSLILEDPARKNPVA
jgi:hypothetical protein